jgi:hypothetical protein
MTSNATASYRLKRKEKNTSIQIPGRDCNRTFHNSSNCNINIYQMMNKIWNYPFCGILFSNKNEVHINVSYDTVDSQNMIQSEKCNAKDFMNESIYMKYLEKANA